jgi:hypothetical protein
MNRRWLIPLIVALVAGAAAFAITRRGMCQRAAAGSDRLRDVSYLTSELKLSPDQARQIEAIHAALSEKLADCCARHCTARARLGEALSGETEGGTGTEAVLAEMCRAYEESERATLDHMRRVRALLDGGQKRRFEAMISNCLCRSCSSHGGPASAPPVRERLEMTSREQTK